jgi:hypothetical protein
MGRPAPANERKKKWRKKKNSETPIRSLKEYLHVQKASPLYVDEIGIPSSTNRWPVAGPFIHFPRLHRVYEIQGCVACTVLHSKHPREIRSTLF